MRLVPGIRYSSVQILYMGHQDTIYAMFACCLLMYTPIGCIPAASTAYTTKGYSHSLPAPHFAVSPVIRRANWWRSTYMTLIIYPINTQFLLTYNCDLIVNCHL